MDKQQSSGIPYQTYLKVGGQYFVSTNIDVSDGLFNGSTGCLKKIDYGATTDNRSVPRRAWLDFNNPLIGIERRLQTKSLQEKKNINLEWTAIDRITRNLSSSGQHQNLQLIRKQIPLVAANGMTIAKAQGSSIPKVVVHIKKYVSKKNQEAPKKVCLYLL